MGAAASAFECVLPIASICLLAAYHYRFSKDSTDRITPLTFTAHGLMSRERAIQHCIQNNDKICLIQAYRCRAQCTRFHAARADALFSEMLSSFARFSALFVLV
jgi:hypothetical protein